MLFILPVRASAEVPIKVDLNYAEQKDLELITGVGPVIAERIVQERPFESVDDLIRVKGIGAKTLEKIRAEDVAFAIKDSETKSYKEWFQNDELAKDVYFASYGLAGQGLSMSEENINQKITYESIKKIDFMSFELDVFDGNMENFYLLGNLNRICFEFTYEEGLSKDRDLSPFKNLRNIYCLEFWGAYSERNNLMSYSKQLLKYFPKVQSIEFDRCHLSSIDCYGNKILSPEGEDLLDQFLSNLYRFKELSYININYSDFNSLEFLSKIETLKQFKGFGVFLPSDSFGYSLSVERYLPLQKLPNLNYVEIICPGAVEREDVYNLEKEISSLLPGVTTNVY
ncbi:helix-hairpin-helix domain-containing protein [Enterococcus sp. BWR-S5]|nr:helix-hairpin-helix domain-containing protein [Enterococcus sp. BWR-S5]